MIASLCVCVFACAAGCESGPKLATGTVAWILLGLGRLGTSVLFLPAMFILLNIFVCPWASIVVSVCLCTVPLCCQSLFVAMNVQPSDGFTLAYYPTGDCDGDLKCYGPLYWILLIICLSLIAAIVWGVWTLRVPSQYLNGFGLPRGLALTIPVRLLLAW